MKRFLLTILLLACVCTPLRAEDVKKSAQQVKISEKAGLHYLLYLPPGYGKDEKKTFPLILFLHGAGETGTKIDLVKKHGPPKNVETNWTAPLFTMGKVPSS